MASFAILCPNAFDYILNKTGNMLIRYRSEDVCCVIDPITSGKTAQDILGFGGEIPVVSNFKAATEFDPNASFAVPHKTNEIKKCVIGEKSLTAHSSFPKIKVENPISHAINGGLVK